MPRPSYIQIGDVYHATIRTDGAEEVLVGDDGRPLRFDCFLKATAYARERIAPRPKKTPPVEAAKSVVDLWREEKARQLAADRLVVDRIGVKVEVKKRRRFFPQRG